MVRKSGNRRNIRQFLSFLNKKRGGENDIHAPSEEFSSELSDAKSVVEIGNDDSVISDDANEQSSTTRKDDEVVFDIEDIEREIQDFLLEDPNAQAIEKIIASENIVPEVVVDADVDQFVVSDARSEFVSDIQHAGASDAVVDSTMQGGDTPSSADNSLMTVAKIAAPLAIDLQKSEQPEGSVIHNASNEDSLISPSNMSVEEGSLTKSKNEASLKPIFRSDGQQVKNHRLGRYVYEKNLITADALDAASKEQEVTGKHIGQILVKNGFLTDKQRVDAILAVEESRISQEQVSKSRIPVQLHNQFSIIISAEHDETIFISSPNDEDEIRAIVEEYYPDKKIEFVSYDSSAMSRFVSIMKRSAAVEDIRETKETMLDRLVYKALEMLASDIHITPQSDCYSVQFRVDGIKRLIRMGPLDEYHTVMAQVKDKATIDLAEKRKPQDGSYQVEYNGKMIDLRIATLPVQNGEHVTIRVLDSDRVHPNLDELGIADVRKWRRAFKQRDGLCVIAGATGSGKTTTLNSSLREIDRFGKAIFTVEDPVEYRIPFVNQVSTNPSVGLDFAAAVKAFMRNDPDVIVLGEVRDTETARNAVKAADTGHLVLITLHTGSIMGTISRLKDLGVEPRELRFMLRGVLVQSLIPKLCQVCKGDPLLTPSCKTCGGEKYVGRTVASECENFESVEAVDRLLNARNDSLSREERTWPTMAEDAVRQMREGLTDIIGLEKVFGSAIYPFLTEEELQLCSNW